ncbi:hypothetical protein EB796_003255 [Bugula neritina]|uniref:Flavin-containing monooxygenase n=1 Tax=Bugula neritina TaxID=10212 RepID=A0A7J7KIC8_BUGNE|nr:hypothetical protein EB796_003255 [Bugula neritina]
MMSFSDYPMPLTTLLIYPRKCFDYVMSYCERFDLEKDIKLQHEVTNVQQSEDYSESGCWGCNCNRLFQLAMRQSKKQCGFDAVMICVGLMLILTCRKFPACRGSKVECCTQDYTNSSEFDARESEY